MSKIINHIPRILIAHGVNLDLLGTREPELYGSLTLDNIHQTLQHKRSDIAHLAGFADCSLEFFQTNDERLFLEKFDQSWSGAVINPGAWTHTSLALADRLKGLNLLFTEVHLTHVMAREPIRRKSLIAPHAVGIVSGFGADSYLLGLLGLLRKIFNFHNNGSSNE